MRDRLILAAVAVVVIFAFGWGADILYFGPGNSAASRLEQLSAELDQLTQRRLRAEADLQAASTSGDQIAGLAAAGEDASAAAAHFQENIRSAVLQSGGVAMSSQSVPADLGGGYSKLSVLLRARFDEAGLMAFIRMNEVARPPILVESIEAHPLPLPGDAHPLDVTATLSEFHADVAAH